MHRIARRLLLAVTLCVALAGGVVAGSAPASAESNGGTRVMPLGDSITDGVGVGGGGYRVGLWQRLAQNGYTTDFVGSGYNGPASLGDHDHEGHSGWRIDQIDANIVNWVRTYQPRTVLLHIGTNDISQNRDLANAPARLAAVVDKITSTSPQTDVFVATLIPVSYADAKVRAYNAAIPGIVSSRAAAGKKVHLVDMYNAVSVSDLTDGVHPNAAGYDKMAAAWFAALRAVPGSLGDRLHHADPERFDRHERLVRAGQPQQRQGARRVQPVHRRRCPDQAVVAQQRQPAAVAVHQRRQRLLQGEVAAVGQGPRRDRQVHRRRRDRSSSGPTTAAPTSSSASRRSTGTSS